MATKRLLQELKARVERPDGDSVSRVGPVSDDDLRHWTAVLGGTRGTAYEDGAWKLDIRIPDNYPLSPPTIIFETPICHPNVHFETGEICLDLLKDAWTPAYTIASTLDAIRHLLSHPEPDSPLNVDIAQLLRAGDDEGAASLIRYYTCLHRWET